MMSLSALEALSKEQIEALLSLVPTQPCRSLNLCREEATYASTNETPQEPRFSNAEMFVKKNAKATPAQIYLLALVRDGAKATNIWNNPPLMKDLTAGQAKKFYDTVYTICPQLRSIHRLLSIRLSRTLINHRLFLRQQKKIPAYCRPQIKSGAASIATSICVQHQNADHTEYVGYSSEDTDGNTSDFGSQDHQPRAQSSSADTTIATFDVGKLVKIMVSADPGNELAVAGKGIYLGKMSTASYEQFAKVLLKSKTRQQFDIELPQATERGKTNFSDLENGEIFVWKISRLQQANTPHASDQAPLTTKANRTSSTHVRTNASEEDTSPLSAYELKRLQNIARNKRKLEEIFDTRSTCTSTSNAKRRKHTLSNSKHVNLDRKEPEKELDVEEPDVEDLEPVVGEYVAVNSKKYNDRPLLGKVTAIHRQEKAITIDWMVGSYSGTWREWRGRDAGRPVIFSDDVNMSDIVLRCINLTQSNRLKAETISTLKKLYSK